MSVSSVGVSPTDSYSSTQSYDTTDATTQSVDATSDTDYNDSWTQTDQDQTYQDQMNQVNDQLIQACCNDSMSAVNQSQEDEKKNDQEVYHQDG